VDDFEKNVYVTNEIIREEGKRILYDLNANKPENEKVSLKFSSGWL